MSPRRRASLRLAVATAVALAAACAGSDAARPADGAGERLAGGATVARVASPGAVDSIAAESLAVDSALRGLVDGGHALFGCLVGDSAVYADLRLDSFGDTVGTRITLWHAGDGVDGTRTEVGEPTPPLPLSGVRLFGADSIMLDFPAANDAAETSRFLGRVSCDRMWGKQRNYRDAPTRPVSYGRVRDPY